MFSELVIAYLFLGGTGGGACVVIGALGLLADREEVRSGLGRRFRDGRGRLYGNFFGAALTVALACLLLGVGCLLADVGRPDRIGLLLALSPVTYVGVGAWALAVCAMLALAALLLWRGFVPARLGLLRVLHGALVFVGAVTVLYTGLLLSTMPSVPLWDTPWLVAVFALSGVSCGIALVVLSAVIGGSLDVFVSVTRRLLRCDSVVILFEAAAVAGWLGAVALAAGSGVGGTPTNIAAQTSLGVLLEGACAGWLWAGLGLVGLLMPLACEFAVLRSAKRRRVASGSRLVRERALPAASVLAASLGVLAGGAVLRYIVVAAAVLPVPVYPF